ncbi:MAG: M20/M25/M40 family metallo-hydrolase [Acidobacteria bacterium]|nr:M20/M25/M40 family metallo-hydrolase [Acidobacteriota bacterium]
MRSVCLLLVISLMPSWAQKPVLSPAEAAIVQAVEKQTEPSIALLERMVNLNSGTYNPAGVRAMAQLMETELKALGFTTRMLPMDAIKRGPHLVAEHKGAGGKPVLLIGHIDTVFEPASPFQKFERKGRSAVGPGTGDMKGGLVVLLAALQGLKQSGQLDKLPITVFLTGDEESPGRIDGSPGLSRQEMVAIAKQSRAALSFEGGHKGVGHDYATTARRGYTGWELRSTGKAGHSGQVFSPSAGYGAIYEITRVVNTFQQTLQEPNMTFNVGLILGGGELQADPDGAATVNGKPNIVASKALARGEIRALTSEQVARTKDRMYAIVAKNLPGTKSEIVFEEGGAPMPPTDGNRRLLEVLNQASQAAGLGEILELDPMLRGAGDISYIAEYTDCLDGLGAVGAGSHAVGETVELDSIAKQAKRAALLVHRLGR